MATLGAGELRERVTFEARDTIDDEYGGQIGDFADQFTVAARIEPLSGGSEAVMGGRLDGKQPYRIKVRYSSSTKLIQANWRVRDARSGKLYAITAPPINKDEHKRYIEMIAVEGAAA